MTIDGIDDYGWNSTKEPRSCDILVPEIVAILGKLNGGNRILDLGSGNGALCYHLHKVGYYVVGIDYDKKGVDISLNQYPEIHFYNYGVGDDPKRLLETESVFDVVVSTEVIEHLYAPHLLPRYAHAVLRDEGYLVVTTPYHGYAKNFLLSLFNKWDSHHMPLLYGGHIKFWSRQTLTKLLENNGFQVLAFSGVGRLSFLWKGMVLVAKRMSSVEGA